MAQYALDRVLSVAGTYAATNSKKGITEGDIAFLADQVTDPSLSFTSETEDIVDARNNVVMTLQGARGATFGASNAFFNTQILAAQTGGKIVNEEVEFTKYDILSLDDSKAVTLTATPSAATPTAKDFKVFSLASDNSLTTATPLAESEYELVQYEAAIGVTSENFASGTYYTKSDSGSATTYTPATEYAASTEYFVKIPCKIKVTAGNKGDKVLISYEAKATGEHMVAKADDSNELMNVTAEVLLRELCKEELNNRVPYIVKCA